VNGRSGSRIRMRSKALIGISLELNGLVAIEIVFAKTRNGGNENR
jgi:hypothetical protein